MSDHYQEFSEMIYDITPEEHNWLWGVMEAHTEDNEPDHEKLHALGIPDEDINEFALWPGFEWEFEEEGFWMYDEYIDLDSFIPIIKHFLRKFRSEEVFVVQWNWNCNKPLVGAFGGGVCVISKDGFKVSDTLELSRRLIEEMEAEKED